MEQFLWRDRLSTADSEISPRMHRESAKGSGAFLFIRTFFPPLTLYEKQVSVHSRKWRHWLKEPFEDRISFLCLCGLRSWMTCPVILELAIWNLHCGGQLTIHIGYNTCHVYLVFIISFNINLFNWRLFTLQYCICFAIHQHKSATGIHMYLVFIIWIILSFVFQKSYINLIFLGKLT